MRVQRPRRRDPQRYVYDVHGLDVWGNAEDGYDVNDVYPSRGSVTLRDGMTDAQIVSSLRREGFIGSRVRTKRVRVDGDMGDALYIEDAKDGKPVYQLRVRGR